MPIVAAMRVNPLTILHSFENATKHIEDMQGKRNTYIRQGKFFKPALFPIRFGKVPEFSLFQCMLTAWNFAAKHLSKIRKEKGTIFYLRKRKLVLEKSAASRSSIKKVPPVGALIKKCRQSERAASRSSYRRECVLQKFRCVESAYY